MADILKNQDGRQFVKLSEHYSYGSNITTAVLAESEVRIDVLRCERKSKRLTLSAAEMDALAEAWAQFKHTVQTAKEVEQKRLDALAEAARERIKNAPAITIEQSTVSNWYNIHYFHCSQWGQYVHASQLNDSLTKLLSRIERHALPLNISDAVSEPSDSIFSDDF